MVNKAYNNNLKLICMFIVHEAVYNMRGVWRQEIRNEKVVSTGEMNVSGVDRWGLRGSRVQVSR